MTKADGAERIRAATERLVAATARQHAALAQQLGVLPIDVRAATLIGRADGLSPAGLARALLISSSGATAVTRRLERAGLVTRTQVTGAGRQVRLQLAPEAHALRGRLTHGLHNDVDEVLATADSELIEELARLMGRLAERSEVQADRLLLQAASGAAGTAIPRLVRWS